MKTQLYIKPESKNILYNGRFKGIDGGWNNYEEDGCGHYFILSDVLNNLLYSNPDPSCGQPIHSVTSSVTTLDKGVKYKVTLNVDYINRTDEADPEYVRVVLGDNYSKYFYGEGTFTDTILCGTSGIVGVEAMVDGHGSIGISYLNITEDRSLEIDLYGEIDIPLTYTIADVREPEKRKSSFAKSFPVPSTPNNDKVFGHIFKISGDVNPNPNKAVGVYILQGGLEIFNGTLQLTNIRINEENKIEYEIDCSGKLANIFVEWLDTKLNDLDYSEYNHIYNKSNQKNTWETSIFKNGATYSNFNTTTNDTFSATYYDSGYLGISFDNPIYYNVGDTLRIHLNTPSNNPNYEGWYKILSTSGFTDLVVACGYGTPIVGESGYAYSINPTGEGYVYPMIDYGSSDGTFYNVEKTYPAVYLKTYIDKIFKYANFNYQSNFFNSNYFKSLIIPSTFESFKISSNQIEERRFRASKTTNELVRYPWESVIYYSDVKQTSILLFDDDSTNTNFDNGLVYNTSNGKWTVNRSGNYDTISNLVVGVYVLPDIDARFGVELTSAGTNIKGNLKIIKKPLSGSNVVLDSVPFTFLGNNDIVVSTGVDMPNQSITTQRNGYQLFQGEIVWIELEWWVESAGSYFWGWNNYFNDGSSENNMCSGPCGNPFAVTGEIYIKILNGTFFNKVNNNELPEGETVELKSVVPEVSIKDLFTSIVRAFNLYIETDKDDERKLIIETRNQFYSSNEFVDWTDLFDTSKSLEIKPMGELQGKDYSYTYKEDKDYYNDDHIKDWKKIYGEKFITIDNDFTKNKVETKLIFSPTIITDYPVGSDRIISSIKKVDATGSKPTSSNIRLLYYGGVKYTSTQWVYKSLITGNTNESFYSYAGHLDNPLYPTEDLNFASPLEVYYDLVEWTNNNLFNKYHKQMVDEITDKDSKIITGYFYLRPSDIYILDFRKQVFVDGNYFRLNKIIDYNGNMNEVSKCEFVKTINKNAFSPEKIKVKGGKDEKIVDEFIPKRRNAKLVNNNSGQSTTNRVIGYNNYISPSSVNSIIDGGENNVIQSNCDGIDITNSNSIVVLGGLINVTVIGSNNIIVDESDVMYIYNTRVKNGIVQNKIDLIDCGEDIKLSPFNSVLPVTQIDCGEDIIIDLGSYIPETFLDGGEV